MFWAILIVCCNLLIWKKRVDEEGRMFKLGEDLKHIHHLRPQLFLCLA